VQYCRPHGSALALDAAADVRTLVPVNQQTTATRLCTKKQRRDPMVDRSVTLIAGAEVPIEGALTLPPGYYRAVKRQIEVSTPTKRQFTEPEYLIELSGRQIVAMGGTPGAIGLISAEVDVSRQVREGLLRLSDRPPAPRAVQPSPSTAPEASPLGRQSFESKAFKNSLTVFGNE
jgi:hypothetical protein